MKITRIIVLVVLCTSILNAQEKDVDCDFNFREALFYLKGDKNMEKDSLKAINYLIPCIEKGNDKAQLLLGRLYMSKENEEDYQKAFDLLKKSAEQGNAIAMADLGVLYKYGKGCRLNFNKARKWFKKSAKLGNDKASYALGYLYFKGFGNIPQNYSKAVKWFEKSKHPMAKYWLGVSYLNGYGVEKNSNKANKLLGANIAENFSHSQNDLDVNKASIQLNEQMNQGNESEQEQDINDALLLGKWKGKLIKLDWSKNTIEEKINIDLSIHLDSLSNTISTIITTKNTSIKDEVVKIDNSIYFTKSRVVLPHKSYSNKIPSELTYELLSADLRLKLVDKTEYLIGSVESYINEWNEPGAPLRLILKKTETFENREEELSDEILEALYSQEENFIKLYPNPFQDDLIIFYTLENSVNTKIQIHDLQGNFIANIKKGGIQHKGNFKYFFDTSRLVKGAYVVSVFVNGKRKTRVIIKK